MLPTIRCIGRSQLIRVGLVTPHDINGVPAYPACAMTRAELGRVLTNARKVPGTSRTPEPRNSRVITPGHAARRHRGCRDDRSGQVRGGSRLRWRGAYSGAAKRGVDLRRRDGALLRTDDIV